VTELRQEEPGTCGPLVRLMIRGDDLGENMSRYLLDRIEHTSVIAVSVFIGAQPHTAGLPTRSGWTAVVSCSPAPTRPTRDRRGRVTLFWPGITTLVLLWWIAAWALVTGVLEIIAAVRLRREVQGEWLLALGGVLSVLFGILLAVRPSEGAVAVAWLIGIYAIVFGIALLALALELRRYRGTGAPRRGAHRPAPA
jgi:hypothetical protein